MSLYDWLAYVGLLVAFVVEARIAGFRIGFYDRSDSHYQAEVWGFIAGSIMLDLILLVLCVFGIGRYVYTSSGLAVPIIGLLMGVACYLISFVMFNIKNDQGAQEREQRTWRKIAWELDGLKKGV